MARQLLSNGVRQLELVKPPRSSGTKLSHETVQTPADCLPLGGLNGPSDYAVYTSSEVAAPEWDAFVQASAVGHHVQTSLWAQVKAVLGWQAVRVVVHQHGGIVGGAQMLWKPLPIGGAIAYVPKGPLLGQDHGVLITLVIDALRRVAKTHRVQYLVIQPPDHSITLGHRLTQLGFWPSPLRLVPTPTVHIDLAPDLHCLLMQMKPKTQHNIQHSQHCGIIVREGTKADLSVFYKDWVAAGQWQQCAPYSQAYYNAMQSHLGPAGHFQLFLADYRSEPVAALLAVPFGNTVIYKQGAWCGLHGNRHPNEALQWAALEWARSHGYRYYELEGIGATVVQQQLKGADIPRSMTETATRFKLGFGGQVMQRPGTYDYVANPLLRWVYRALYPFVLGPE